MPGRQSRQGWSKSTSGRGSSRVRRSRPVFTVRFQAWVRRNAQRLARLLSRLPVTPNMVTVAGMLITFAAAALVGLGFLLVGGVVLALAGAFAVLDGAVARATKRQ